MEFNPVGIILFILILFVVCLFASMALIVLLQAFKIIEFKNSTTFFIPSIILAIVATIIIIKIKI